MSNSIVLFDNQQTNGTSAIFIINRPDSKDFADTEFSSYLEIYGGAGALGNGSLQLHKKAKDGIFRKLEAESTIITANFPATVNSMQIESINYKSDEQFKLVLTGSTAPNLFVNGYNIKLA